MALERCRCGAPRRAGQKNCRQCHREDERRRRKGRKDKAEQLRQRCAFLRCEDQRTREQFEAQCQSRFVLVQPEKDARFAGYVVGFWPGGRLDILDSLGALHRIDLHRVAHDKARSWIELATRDLKLPELPPRPSLSCECNGPRSAGQGPCQKCRREYQRAYREADKQYVQRWRRIVEILTTDNPATRAQFEAKSRSRFVVVLGDGSKQIYTATVTAFHMGGYLTVVDYFGRSHSARLEGVVEDVGRGPELLN
jgi:hypothetical protein